MKKFNLIVTIKPWNLIFFKKNLSKLKGNWQIISKLSELENKKLLNKKIENIFFIHWSNLVPDYIIKKYNCIGFHMTDLPYGKGGSPLQNLILAGKKKTKITAYKMTNKIDSGPIYFKFPLNLSGSAKNIFQNATKITLQMIIKFQSKKINPKKQKQAKIIFKRLSRKDNFLNFKKIKTLNKLYDYIRMVDAPTYPNAFFKKSNFIFEFKNIKKNKNELLCYTKIKYEK